MNQLAGLRFAEGGSIAHQFIKSYTQAVLVARKGVFALHQTLRRHVTQGAIVALCHQRSSLAIVQDGGKAEIAHTQHAISIQQKVAGLYIAVQHAAGMRIGQCLGRLQAHLRHSHLIRHTGVRIADGGRGNPLPVHQAHHVIAIIALLTGTEHLHNVGVVQPGNHAGFILKRLTVAFIRIPGRRKDFDGHLTVQRFLHGAEHRAHAACADTLHQAIATQRFGITRCGTHRRTVVGNAQGLHIHHAFEQIVQILRMLGMRRDKFLQSRRLAATQGLQILLHQQGKLFLFVRGIRHRDSH